MTTLRVLLGVDLGSMDEEEEVVPPPPPGLPKRRPNPSPWRKIAPRIKKKKQALKEKELGNNSYKKKDCDTALKHYSWVRELDPSNMTYLTNQALCTFRRATMATARSFARPSMWAWRTTKTTGISPKLMLESATPLQGRAVQGCHPLLEQVPGRAPYPGCAQEIPTGRENLEGARVVGLHKP